MMDGLAVLPDTTLCAIVRDEMMNPAGGIVRFCESVLPHVESAVIVDTGSIDGTREALEEMRSKHGLLNVYDHRFDGFARSRNYALDQVQTTYALVLDADEMILKDDWGRLAGLLRRHPRATGWDFKFVNVYPSGEKETNGHNPRLFKNGHARYSLPVWETLSGAATLYTKYSDIAIYHFCPAEEAVREKQDAVYDAMATMVRRGEVPAPSTFSGFSRWKAYNPLRDQYE